MPDAHLTCPFCGGSCCADSDSSRPCVVCNGQGFVVDHGAPKAEFVTERFTVTGRVTERVLVTWPDGTVHTLYRP